MVDSAARPRCWQLLWEAATAVLWCRHAVSCTHHTYQMLVWHLIANHILLWWVDESMECLPAGTQRSVDHWLIINELCKRLSFSYHNGLLYTCCYSCVSHPFITLYLSVGLGYDIMCHVRFKYKDVKSFPTHYHSCRCAFPTNFSKHLCVINIWCYIWCMVKGKRWSTLSKQLDQHLSSRRPQSVNAPYSLLWFVWLLTLTHSLYSHWLASPRCYTL